VFKLLRFSRRDCRGLAAAGRGRTRGDTGGGQSWKADRIDRSWTTISQPQALNAFGVYKLPFGGSGQLGSGSLLMRELVGGWQLSGTYQYASGLPVVTTWSGGCPSAAPNSGACEPDINPAAAAAGGGSARIGGSYGTGPLGRIASNLGLAGGTPIKYVDPNIFKTPTDVSAVPGSTHQYLIGNAPRTRVYNLQNPGSQNLNAALHRSFPIREGISFLFEADCFNVWNKVQIGGPGGGWSATASSTTSTFGEVTTISNSPRDWMFAGHVNF